MSIRKISIELGLSSATVSWILSGQGEKRGFKEETIKRVQEYAKSINYSPNLVARSLSKGSTKTIGIIIPFISDVYFSSMVQEIETWARKLSYGITICSSGGDESREAELIELLLNQQVDGLILSPSGVCDKNARRLKERGCPFVLVDRHSATVETHFIESNNLQCSCDLTKRMVAQGAKKIAIVTSESHITTMKDRLNGYIKGLKESGIDFNESLIIDIDRLDYTDGGGNVIEELLKKNPDIDGLFFTTHYLALSAIKHFTEHGIDYNSRFKMASIYNSTWLKLLAPAINMARVPIQDISQSAVELLIEAVKDRNLPICQRVIDNEIV